MLWLRLSTKLISKSRFLDSPRYRGKVFSERLRNQLSKWGSISIRYQTRSTVTSEHLSSIQLFAYPKDFVAHRNIQGRLWGHYWARPLRLWLKPSIDGPTRTTRCIAWTYQNIFLLRVWLFVAYREAARSCTRMHRGGFHARPLLFLRLGGRRTSTLCTGTSSPLSSSLSKVGFTYVLLWESRTAQWE